MAKMIYYDEEEMRDVLNLNKKEAKPMEVEPKINGILLSTLLKQAYKEVDDKDMDYSGAFESDIIEDDVVNSPPHYNKGGIECIDAIEAMLTHEEFVGYLRGNSLKYRWRFRYKNGIQDLEKAEWYENKLMETLKENETN
jgi:hypothetical protein